MPGKAAVVLTAAALSVTVGVLIGIVLIIGNKARQSSIATVPSPVATTAAESGGPPGGDPAPSSDPAPAGGTVPVDDGAAAQISLTPAVSSSATTTSTVPARPTPTSSTPHRPAAVRPSRPAPVSSAVSPKPTVTRPAIVFTTVTIAPPTSSSVVPAPDTLSSDSATSSTSTSTAAGSGTTSSGTSTATAPAPEGAPAPGRPCAVLGDKATAVGGSTVFCQHDFGTGSLAWRAVVDGGGCLSKKMTGTGADGQHYRCRPDSRGLDHWRRA